MRAARAALLASWVGLVAVASPAIACAWGGPQPPATARRQVFRRLPDALPPDAVVRPRRGSVRGPYAAFAVLSAANAVAWVAVATVDRHCTFAGATDTICEPIPEVAGVPLVGPWLALGRMRSSQNGARETYLIFDAVAQDVAFLGGVAALLLRRPYYEVFTPLHPTAPAEPTTLPELQISTRRPTPRGFDWTLLPSGAGTGLAFAAAF